MVMISKKKKKNVLHRAWNLPLRTETSGRGGGKKIFSHPLPSSLLTDENNMEVKVLKVREQKYVCTEVYSEILGNRGSISSFKLSFQV